MKTMNRKAVIDIGTNTFNLLVAEINTNKTIKFLHEERIPVKLGQGSMNDGIIKPDAIERAVEAINYYKSKAGEFNIQDITAFATSAVRSSKNGNDFIRIIKNNCDLDIHIISGDKEAELIYYGVKHAVKMDHNQTYLILDIGGGSNEFILCNHEEIIWKKSYNLGITRLIEKIIPTDPISEENIQALKKYTNSLINDLTEKCRIHKPLTLLGASGSFETFSSMILFEKYGNNDLMILNTGLEIYMDDLERWHDKLVKTTEEERKNIPGLPLWRINMIVPAIVFTKHIIEILNIKKLYLSDYSMKEGVIFSI